MKRSEKGQSLVEFAALVPLLALLLFGIIEFGISLYDYEQETNAVGVAARQLASSRGQTNDPCQLVAQAIEGPNENGVGGAAPALLPANLTLNVTLTFNGNQYYSSGPSAGYQFSCQGVNLMQGSPGQPSSAQVQASYPCNLSLVNITACTLTTQTTEYVQ